MMTELFRLMLSIDSTSGRERDFALWLEKNLDAPRKTLYEVGDGSCNLMLSWGEPQIVFCTHMDTVPPYIAPVFDEDIVRGRGSCDAKGQIFSMYSACRALADSGREAFALLLLSGEETGSFGAKAFSRTGFTAPYLVIGEPTDNCMVSASKGTKSFDLHFTGKSCHSGYPQYGRSAVDMFVDFMDGLRSEDFGDDALLGRTTFNVGLLRSDNPQNVLSPSLDCRLYFRTTFSSDSRVCSYMAARACPEIEVIPRGGDAPAEYFTLPGFRTAPASFGSDAPHLNGFTHKMICGPGSILTAHRDNEQVAVKDLEEAMENYVRIYENCYQRLR